MYKRKENDCSHVAVKNTSVFSSGFSMRLKVCVSSTEKQTEDTVHVSISIPTTTCFVTVKHTLCVG